MWRFVGGRDARDEVEVVLNVSTTSYVALGKSVSFSIGMKRRVKNLTKL